MYARLQEMASTQKLQQLMQYVGRNWITGRNTWPPSSWSVFMKFVRTNNDIEGWNFGLNRRVSGKVLASSVPPDPPPSPRGPSDIPSDQACVRGEVTAHSEKKFRDLRTKIFNLWDEFNSGARSARKLLKACSYLNGPGAS